MTHSTTTCPTATTTGKKITTVHRLAALVSLAPLLLLAACGQAPWEKASATSSTAVSVAPKATSTATSTAVPTAGTTASTSAVENDLAKGSVERKLSAGGVQLTVHYWSTLSVDKWTASATKPLNVSITGRFADGSKQNIYLDGVTMSTDVTGAKGPLQAPAVFTDQSSTAPGYVIKAPGSYGNVITIPALDSAATSMTLNFTYQVLAQSAPKSTTYLKQAAADTMVIALAR